MGWVMGKSKDEDNIKDIKKDERNLEIARRRWEETANLEDDAVIFSAEIREEVEDD